jgi:hypothetical protein
VGKGNTAPFCGKFHSCTRRPLRCFLPDLFAIPKLQNLGVFSFSSPFGGPWFLFFALSRVPTIKLRVALSVNNLLRQLLEVIKDHLLVQLKSFHGFFHKALLLFVFPPRLLFAFFTRTNFNFFDLQGQKIK